MGVLDLFRLDGQTALVTGCRAGIGKAMAIALAEAGADIIGVSSSLEATGSEVEQAVLEHGRNFSAYTCDFNQRDSVYDFVQQVQSDHSTVDILVNNAGTVRRARAEEFPDEYWDQVLSINLGYPIYS